jgi:hypothetical protein
MPAHALVHCVCAQTTAEMAGPPEGVASVRQTAANINLALIKQSRTGIVIVCGVNRAPAIAISAGVAERAFARFNQPTDDEQNREDAKSSSSTPAKLVGFCSTPAVHLCSRRFDCAQCCVRDSVGILTTTTMTTTMTTTY